LIRFFIAPDFGFWAQPRIVLEQANRLYASLRILPEGDLMKVKRDSMRLAHRDLTALISALPELYAPASLRMIRQKILQIVLALVPCLTATYDEWDVDREGQVLGYRVAQRPVIPEVDAALPSLPMFIHTHPLFPMLQRRLTQPLKISDVASRQQFARTAVFNEFYRRLDVQHQMAWFLPGTESPYICVVLNRQGRDFSERDRQVLSLLSPHLRQARMNALAFDQATCPTKSEPAAGGEGDWEVVHIDANGHPQLFSKRAADWLEAYFGEAGEFSPWPEALRRWIRQQAWAARPNESALSPRQPLVLERGAGRLNVAFVPGRDGFGLLLLSQTQTAPWPKGILRSLPLTEREQEVFRWICEGKTNPEIAVILGISRRTVDKHIEHLLGKLGLENRFQAQRLGWELRRPDWVRA
jgi:DNA-binding CsgD family transcriptional regulator